MTECQERERERERERECVGVCLSMREREKIQTSKWSGRAKGRFGLYELLQQKNENKLSTFSKKERKTKIKFDSNFVHQP